MHSVKEGPANQSYGLQVAALAGVPQAVIRRARARLQELELSAARHTDNAVDQLSLFSEPCVPQPDPLRDALDGTDPDELSPREALDLLYRLKRLAAD
jgi:DNA mismatch repair protein MutS